MNLVKKLGRKLEKFLSRIFHALKHFRHIYRYGGYTTAKISYIQHGSILRGKRVLITGGSSGIGLSIAKKCIEEGAIVLITGRNESRLESARETIKHDSLKTLLWDVSSVGIINEKLEEAKALLGGDIDILVNNAGIVNGSSFLTVTEQQWDDVYSINSKGLFFLTQALCDSWIKNKREDPRKVINISSQGGFVGATYPYRMTKWDLVGLTQGLGMTMAPHRILINGIAPGVTATKALPSTLEQGENIYYSLNPLKRHALPEEMAELALFLMSDASNFIVGQTIVCDGGYSIK